MVGDGGDGGAPFKFSIALGRSAELAYIKVFWSVDPLELDYLKQEPAFKLKLAQENSRGWQREESAVRKEWGTLILKLILRRPSPVVQV